MSMKKKNVQENGHDQNPDVNVSVNINSDENIDGNQHLNEPVAEESEIEKLKGQAGLSEEQAQKVIDTIKNFVVEKYPMLSGAVNNMFGGK